jgi:hypothetical protein
VKRASVAFYESKPPVKWPKGWGQKVIELYEGYLVHHAWKELGRR